MQRTSIKKKIQTSLDQMNDKQLQSAWLILKELGNQKQYDAVIIDKSALHKNLTLGIEQLNNDEGKDFRLFLNEMQEQYGKN
jgi:hypothetical protein